MDEGKPVTGKNPSPSQWKLARENGVHRRIPRFWMAIDRRRPVDRVLNKLCFAVEWTPRLMCEALEWSIELILMFPSVIDCSSP
jgi:hypothetical protein